MSHLSLALHRIAATITTALQRRGDRGQATAEYVLLLLGAAAVATLVVAWASSTGKVGNLLDTVVKSITDKVS